MLQLSLGDDFSLVATEPAAPTVASRFKQMAARVTDSFTLAPTREPVTTPPIIAPDRATGACLPGDAMSEFGCITPKVPGPGYSAMNSYYVCPPNSVPYSDQWCLRSAAPKTSEIPTEHTLYEAQPPPPVMTMYVCADGTRVADPSACPVIATETVPTEPEPTDGSGQSPGMQVTPSTPPIPGPDDPVMSVPQWTAEQERKRWTKWATIGAVVIGAGVVAAVLRR